MPRKALYAELNEMLKGAGINDIRMTRKDFMAEHRKLIKLLKSSPDKRFQREAKEQAKEVAKYKGGMERGEMAVVALPKKALMKEVRKYLKKMREEWIDLIEVNHLLSSRTDLSEEDKKFIREEVSKKALTNAFSTEPETESDEGSGKDFKKLIGGLANYFLL